MELEFFDPEGELTIREGNLPHWHQAGVTYFVTFRTEDSIPQDVARAWCARRDEWLRRHGIDAREKNWTSLLHRLSQALRTEFHKAFSREFTEYLDRGYGECVLKRPELAQIVAISLHHFDADRYHLGDFVVMPNHVHLLVCLFGNTDIERQCYSWKKFTAGKINEVLGRKGRFWQEESFDHIVRNAEQYANLCKYIAENPGKANLHEGEYLLYQRLRS